MDKKTFYLELTREQAEGVLQTLSNQLHAKCPAMKYDDENADLLLVCAELIRKLRTEPLPTEGTSDVQF